MTGARDRHGGRPAGRMLGPALAALGSVCWKHPWLVLFAWLLAALISGLAAPRLPERLLSGSGDIAESMSLRVDEALRSDFTGNNGQSLILAFRSKSLDDHPVELAALRDQLQRSLGERPLVGSVTSGLGFPDRRLSPKPGTGHLLVIDLKAENVLAAEQEVPRLRAAVSPVLHAAKARHPDLDWALTGRAALTYDLNRFNAEDTARAEIRTLPLTLVILVLAFGSLAAAMLPLLLAVVTRTVALGIIFLLAGSIEVSNLVQSIVTMLAIALGIDYSLFLIHRYRQLLVPGAASPATGAAAREELAIRGAMTQSGAAVLYSGATVAIGMGALLVTPLMQTRSIGIGGLFAVLVSLLASLTLVPALLRLLGRRALEWPMFLSRRMGGDRSQRLWSGWARFVMRRPAATIAVSLALLLALGAPALHTRFGFPEGEFLPAELEYSRGMEMLADMQLKGLVSPIVVLISDTGKGAALTPERAPALAGFVSRLENDSRVQVVLGPVESTRTESARTIEEAIGRALARDAFISDDESRLLFQIIPSGQSTLAELRKLAEAIPAWLNARGLRVDVGGQAQYYNDFDVAVSASYPMTIGLVLGMSTLALLLFFRAPLASAKAILLNLLSVAAGYGVVVLVFQLGHGSELFGMSAPTQVVPITVPLVIFCILFGLSMDYEIFLLSRVRTIFTETGDNDRSIREALADTGSVITSAALIMVAVFGAFAFARIFIVQMIGLGLAVAVLVDATVIRSALGPALMQLAGRWNWWPLKR